MESVTPRAAQVCVCAERFNVLANTQGFAWL